MPNERRVSARIRTKLGVSRDDFAFIVGGPLTRQRKRRGTVGWTTFILLA